MNNEKSLKKFIKAVIDELSCCEYGHPGALDWFLQQDLIEYNADFVEFNGDAKLCAKWYKDHVAYK